MTNITWFFLCRPGTYGRHRMQYTQWSKFMLTWSCSIPSKPRLGLPIINVDVALSTNMQWMGASIILWDHCSRILTRCCCAFEYISLPEIVEARAVRHALSFAVESGFDSIVLPSDCLNLITQLNSCSPDRTSTGTVVYDIMKALEFMYISCVHVNQFCNRSLMRSPSMWSMMLVFCGSMMCWSSSVPLFVLNNMLWIMKCGYLPKRTAVDTFSLSCTLDYLSWTADQSVEVQFSIGLWSVDGSG
jgi:hypothetical protein